MSETTQARFPKKTGLFAGLLALSLLAAAGSGRKTTILILGDSLTEGYGVEKEDAFPEILDAKLKAWRDGYHVINGGSSGSTSAGGVRRLKWYEKAHPDLVILALGSNDGLRGVKPEETRKNVDAAVAFCEQKGWRVVLAGLKVPPNYGAEYADAFAKVFPDLAASHKIPYMGFLLEGVAGEAEMNQTDGIHPNENGHRRIAENLFQYLKTQISQGKF